jgi:hypothetical protein
MTNEEIVIDDRPAMEVVLDGGKTDNPNVRRLDDDDVTVETRVGGKADGADELRQQLDTERRAREAAEARARDLENGVEGERMHAARQRMVSDHREVSTALHAIGSAQADAQRRYQESLEQGDFGEAAKIQSEIAEIAAEKRDAEKFKAKVEAAIERAKREPPPRQQSSDPLEATLAQMTKPTADWLRKNPDFVTDPTKNARAMAAHHTAMAEGIAADTPQYFAFIEKQLGLAEEKSERSRDDRGRFEREAPVQAPVSNRASQSSVGVPQRSVTLSREEVNFCELNDIDPETYAREKVKLQANGELGRGR